MVTSLKTEPPQKWNHWSPSRRCSDTWKGMLFGTDSWPPTIVGATASRRPPWPAASASVVARTNRIISPSAFELSTDVPRCHGSAFLFSSLPPNRKGPFPNSGGPPRPLTRKIEIPEIPRMDSANIVMQTRFCISDVDTLRRSDRFVHKLKFSFSSP